MMRRNPQSFRFVTTVALGALLSGVMPPPIAEAQPAPPPLPGQVLPPDQNQGDPPTRVGRVARVTGQVSYRAAEDTVWSVASLNYPVSSGYAFWTEPAAAAALEISDSRVVLAGSTEFDVSTLDSAGLQAVVAQGEIYLRLRDLAPDEAWSVQTPRGLVRLTAPGRYAILAGTTEQPTLMTVLEGAADIQGPNLSLQVNGNQTATITGSDSFTGSIGPALRDGFLTAQLAAERPRPVAAAVPQYVVAMPGGSDLGETGSWSQAPQFGQVWYPPVSPGWVPYRHGHWAYVAPWGWTWMDDAPWGFAPFHYGRWVEIDGRWAWSPGAGAVAERPVYAPALVTFIGIGAGIAVGAALASHSICWVPLGPREPYRPWYHASDRYVRQVNINHVTNVTTVNTTNVTVNNFINRGAATAVPAAAMTASRPVQTVAQPVTAQQFATARPVVGQQPVAPQATTAGVTPGVARRLNLSPAGAPAPSSAPGPVVHAQAPSAGVRPTLAVPGVHPAPDPGPHPNAASSTIRSGQPGPPVVVTPGEHPVPGREPHPGAAGGNAPAAQPSHPVAPALATPAARPPGLQPGHSVPAPGPGAGATPPGERPAGPPLSHMPPANGAVLNHPPAGQAPHAPPPPASPPPAAHPASPPAAMHVAPHPAPAPVAHAAPPPMVQAAPPPAAHPAPSPMVHAPAPAPHHDSRPGQP